MIGGNIDLHLHTTCSDGQDTPEELVVSAFNNNFSHIAVTDHDTVTGIDRAKQTASGTSLEIIPGIELSAIDDGDDVHILGYYIDYSDESFLEVIGVFREKRLERAREIVEQLNRLGLDIHFDTVLKVAHGAPVGRPHIAEALYSEELIDSYHEAFHRFIGAHGPAYVPKFTISPREAIDVITGSGGVPVLAHPSVIDRDEMIPEWVDYGLMGIECIHPLHSVEMTARYLKMAKSYNLVPTGGSDWHGTGRSRTVSKLKQLGPVSHTAVARLKELAKTRDHV